MRLAYVCTDKGVPIYGRKGCSVHVQEMLRAFKNLGANITIFATRTEGDPPGDIKDMALVPLPVFQTFKNEISIGQCQKANDQLKDFLKQHGPFDFIYERNALWSYAAMEYAHDHSIPGLLEMNAPLIAEQANYRQLVNRQMAEVVVQRTYDAATTILAVSKEVGASLNSSSLKSKVIVVPNGVNQALYKTLKTVENTEDHDFIIIGFVGSYKPWHGLANLVTVFSELYERYPQARLLIVGDGPKRAEITQQVRDLGLTEVVEMTGAVSPVDIPRYLQRMHISVAPYPENVKFYFSPLKVFEYMAAGCAVVASRVGQLEDIIEHEVDGLLFDPNDLNQMVEAIKRLIEDVAYRISLGQTARLKILDQYTWEKNAQKVCSIVASQQVVDQKL